jgi:hypothetical protein
MKTQREKTAFGRSAVVTAPKRGQPSTDQLDCGGKKRRGVRSDAPRLGVSCSALFDNFHFIDQAIRESKPVIYGIVCDDGPAQISNDLMHLD